MHKGFEAIDSLDQQIQKGCLEGTVYLRMTFPAVVATASPLSVLPQFVEVLGKKIDKIQDSHVMIMSIKAMQCSFKRPAR